MHDDDSSGEMSGQVVVAQSPVLFEALENMTLTELPKEKISAALIRVDERISQEVWRSVLQFMYQGTIFPEHCSYLQDVGKCVELLRACLLYKSHLFQLLPSSPPSYALQVFALCTADEHAKNEETSSRRPLSLPRALCAFFLALLSPMPSQNRWEDLRCLRDGAAWVLLYQAHSVFIDIEATDLCDILCKVVRCLENAVFENPEQPTVMEDHLSYSFRAVGSEPGPAVTNTDDMLHSMDFGSLKGWQDQRSTGRLEPSGA
eukprot:g15093.t1